MKLFLSSAGVLAASLAVHRAAGAFPSSVMELIDDSVDPCEDFYQYACGSWIKNTDIPDNKSAMSYSFGSIGDLNALVLQEIVTAGWPIVTELYESCMDVDTLNALGNEPLQPMLTKIQAVTTTEELFTVAGELFVTEPAFLTAMYVGPDDKNSLLNVVSIGAASLGLDTSYYFDNDTFSALEPAYREYISTIMALSGYSPDCDSATLADAVIAVELQIISMQKTASASVDAEDPDATYNPVTLGEAMEAFPWSIGLYIGGMGVLEASELTNDTVVVFQSLDYFDAVEEWLDTADLDSLKTYLAFSLVNYKVTRLSDDFYDAYFQLFGVVLSGQEERPSRESVCAGRVSASFPDLISRYYVADNFDEKSKEDMKFLIESIETAMGNRLEEVDWLDDATFDEAETKLEKVINFIGYEPQNVTYPYVLASDAYFENREKISLAAFTAAFKKIGRPAIREELEVEASDVNAYYYPSKNAMVFLAGMLHAPFYNHSSHPAQNFGAIGMVVGHELTHGFDSSGRLYDGDGNQRDWWTDATSEQFDSRAQCLRNQYSGFEVLGEDGTSLGFVDGNLTITENIADNGGLGLAFDAYQAFKKDPTTLSDGSGASGVTEEEADKLFFVSFAQNWCEVMRDETMQQALTDTHSPGQWRTNGVAMNSKDFATTFQCSASAKMNPADKCVLW